MFKKITSALLVVICMAAGAIAQNPEAMRIMPLNEGWQFRQLGQATWMPAAVPGTVHTDLMANGKIKDPFYRINERDVQWVDKSDWEYVLDFNITPELLAADAATLLLEGLDTRADVYLNDSLILRADNFFLAWELQVKQLLRPGQNRLRVYFHSPTRVSLERLAAHSLELPAVNDQSENGGMGDKRVSVFLRKPGYHFGWDWGPRLVSIGIWRQVQFRFWNKARLEDVFFRQDSITPQKAGLTAICEVEVLQSGSYTLEVRADGRVFNLEKLLEPGKQTLELPFGIENPRLWWTKELGEPYLYTAEARLINNGTTLSQNSQRIGIRTIRVIQKPDPDGRGNSFYFELNGRPVFAKGANYIPNDVFLPRVSPQTYERLIHSAVEANMNMLRVWGGGFYEEKRFYDLCDENGILIWQDFMFACSMYPGDPEFLISVQAEARYNVRRLRNHPCIALWCGNNEIDVAWANFEESWGWGWKQQFNPTQRKYIWDSYEKVFHEILPETVVQHHPGMFYWPSSPYNVPGKHAGYDTRSGDIHYWGVWHGQHPFSDFFKYIGRFMSEYGFQSFPEFRTVKSYTLPEDWNIESIVMAAHQRSGIGNLRIRSYMEDHYIVPSNFEHMLYIGQVLQAEGIQMAIEAHRSAMPYNMGTLYWQLNDCWPVASWSGIDYYLRWKAMHYFVKKAFAPVAIASREVNDSLRINVISDLPDSLNAILELELINFKGKVLKTRSIQVKMESISVWAAEGIPVAELANAKTGKQRMLVITLRRGAEVLHRRIHYFQPVKQLDLPTDPGIKKTVLPNPSGPGYIVRLSAVRLAKNLLLEFPEAAGHFSDNYFDLLPCTSIELIFTPEQSMPLSASDLKITTIADTYLRK